MRRTFTTVAALAAGLAVFAATGPALAHVRVSSENAVAGGYAVLTFTVPTEKDDASTIGLTVQVPTTTPLASVSVEPKPGWTFTATKQKLSKPVTTDDGPVTEVVSQLRWQAASGQGIAPGQFERFVVSAGPLPNASSMTFKALQNYSDGTTVSWIETPAPGSTAEPEHPAPVLSIQPSAGASPSPSPSSSAPSASAPASQAAASSGGSSGLAVAALVVAIGAVLVAAGAVVAARRRSH